MVTISGTKLPIHSICEGKGCHALNKVKGLFVKDDVLPQVIFTERDLFLMNALEVVFPFATNFLCEFYISKSVRAKCKILVTKAKDCEAVMDAWKGLMNFTNEKIYEQQLKSFTNICARYLTFSRVCLLYVVVASYGDVCTSMDRSCYASWKHKN